MVFAAIDDYKLTFRNCPEGVQEMLTELEFVHVADPLKRIEEGKCIDIIEPKLIIEGWLNTKL